MIIGPTLLINETNKNRTCNHQWPQGGKKPLILKLPILNKKSNTMLQVIVKTF